MEAFESNQLLESLKLSLRLLANEAVQNTMLTILVVTGNVFIYKTYSHSQNKIVLSFNKLSDFCLMRIED